jgi:hypothetical protein
MFSGVPVVFGPPVFVHTRRLSSLSLQLCSPNLSLCESYGPSCVSVCLIPLLGVHGCGCASFSVSVSSLFSANLISLYSPPPPIYLTFPHLSWPSRCAPFYSHGSHLSLSRKLCNTPISLVFLISFIVPISLTFSTALTCIFLFSEGGVRRLFRPRH